MRRKLREIEQQNTEDTPIITDLGEKKETMKKSSSPDYFHAFPALSKEWDQANTMYITPTSQSWPSSSSTRSNQFSVHGTNNVTRNTSGVKRKSKRRRNQAINKGKSSYGRKCVSGHTSAVWDTEFEGTWEMGKDLIREFVVKQNNRNRSISESDASKFVEFKNIMYTKRTADEQQIKCSNNNNNNNNNGSLLIQNMLQDVAINTNTVNIEVNAPPQLEFKCKIDKIDDDKVFSKSNTFSTMSDVDRNSVSIPRRLYERDVSNESINTAVAQEESNDLAIFEAKFNRSVEALWDTDDYKQHQEPELPKMNIESFWFNYYKHHYNNSHNESQSLFVMPTTQINSQMAYNSGPNVSDVPANPQSSSQQIFFDQLTQRKFRDMSSSHSGMNLTSSIWSENAASEDDVSFYANALWDSASVAQQVVQSSQVCLVEHLYAFSVYTNKLFNFIGDIRRQCSTTRS